MPECLRLFGYHVYFFLNENDPLEPVHVHVSKTVHKNATKIWINSDGTCQLAHNKDRIPNKDITKLMDSISIYSEDIVQEWQNRFGEVTYHDKR